jgi:Zn ribbon nucleic-acid-binding protein
MIDFPKNEREFDSTCKDKDSCLEYIYSVRWPDGLRCPKCQNDKHWRNDKGRVLECSACGHKARLLAGTIFQDTKIPIRLWLKIMWHLMSQKFGTNALGLTRAFAIKESTAWNVPHKLRRTMDRADRAKLSPVDEVDETYIGAAEEGAPGRGFDKRSLVAFSVGLGSDHLTTGRVRMETIPNASAITLVAFIQKNAAPGATVLTDGWRSYSSLPGLGFKHIVRNASQDKEALEHAHTVFSP